MPTAARLVSIVVAVASVALGADPPGPAVALDSVTLDATKLRVHFIDFGPGLAVLIETSNDPEHVFVDGEKPRSGPAGPRSV